MDAIADVVVPQFGYLVLDDDDSRRYVSGGCCRWRPAGPMLQSCSAIYRYLMARHATSGPRDLGIMHACELVRSLEAPHWCLWWFGLAVTGFHCDLNRDKRNHRLHGVDFNTVSNFWMDGSTRFSLLAETALWEIMGIRWRKWGNRNQGNKYKCISEWAKGRDRGEPLAPLIEDALAFWVEAVVQQAVVEHSRRPDDDRGPEWTGYVVLDQNGLLVAGDGANDPRLLEIATEMVLEELEKTAV